MENCKKGGNEIFVEGILGKSGYDKVRHPKKILLLGTNLIRNCCANCGHVESMRVEDPDKLEPFFNWEN